MLPDATAIADGVALVTAGTTAFPVIPAFFAIALIVIAATFVYKRLVAGAPRR